MRTTFFLWLGLLGLLQAGGLTFDSQLVEVKALADDKSVTAEFSFTNKTDQPVTIAKMEKTCSCLAVQVKDGKLRYAPGEKGVIRAAFDLGNLSGVVDKTVLLWVDKDPTDKPSVVLIGRVHVPVLVALDQKTLKWTLGAQPAAQKIDITMCHTKPIKILSANCSTDAFAVELKTLEEGKHYELLVTPAKTNSPALGIIRIETDCELARHKTQQAFATVRKDLPGPPPTPTTSSSRP